MKVKELIKQLKKADPEALVVLQRDPEGNGYSPVAGADHESFFNKDGYGLEVYHNAWSAQDCLLEEDECAMLKKKNKCVVIWPQY